MNKKQQLARIIVRQRKVVKVLEDCLDDERMCPCPDVPLDTLVRCWWKHKQRVKRAGEKLFKLTGVMIPEISEANRWLSND